jgi:hypothetical protein
LKLFGSEGKKIKSNHAIIENKGKGERDAAIHECSILQQKWSFRWKKAQRSKQFEHHFDAPQFSSPPVFENVKILV